MAILGIELLKVWSSDLELCNFIFEASFLGTKVLRYAPRSTLSSHNGIGAALTPGGACDRTDSFLETHGAPSLYHRVSRRPSRVMTILILEKHFTAMPWDTFAVRKIFSISSNPTKAFACPEDRRMNTFQSTLPIYRRPYGVDPYLFRESGDQQLTKLLE